MARIISSHRAHTPKALYTSYPPAHSIGEYALPNGTLQHTTIEEEAGGGSSAEEDEGGVSVEVHENSRFGNGKVRAKTVPQAPPSRHVSFSLRGPKASTSAHPLGEPSSLRGDSPTKKSRTRAGSMLGSLAALFHVGGSRNDPEEPARTSPSKPQGRWQTRIDRNLAAARRGDSSDDELPALSHTYAPRSASPAPILLNSPVKGSPVDGGGDAHRLRKRAAKRGSVQVPSPARLVNADKGYASDTVAESVSKARAKSGKQSARAKPASELGVNGSAGPSTPKNGPGGGTRLKKSPNVAAALLSESQPSLSRNSSISKQSISSAASAPPRTTASAHTPTPSPLGRQNSSSRQRTASLNVTSTASGSSPSTPTKHKRTFSTSATPTPPRPVFTNGEPSLMTIVEGISRINKEAAIKQDPNRLLVVPKAPGPVNITVSESLGETSATGRQQAEGLPAPRPRPKKEGQPEENNYRNSLLMSASVSAPSLPIATASQPKPLPAKMPLRSALRNASRTPSPNPPQPQAAVPNGNASPTPLIIPAAIPRSATMSTITPELMMKRRESDISSISSYETGREVLDDTDEDEPPSPSFPVPPPPPPHDDHTRAPTGGSEVSTSTASTASTASPPVRRKSVRMSLPPTFSATPPALDDTDEDDNEVRGRHEPWSSRSASDPSTPRAEPSAWGTRIAENGTRDVWEDSSDEDAEYSAAKRLLARMSRKHEH
ncbi:hypothetical protein C8Q78DRAFT_281005 [Trametes maxima]|nr:hypothetical protein C8Q78DRAFT_281005 [Trametes maxima]